MEQSATSFTKDQSGSVAVIFGLTMVAIFAAAGGALDFNRAMSAKTRLSAAADAAALAGAVTSEPDRVSVSVAAFKANNPSATDPSVHVQDAIVRVTAREAVPTTLLNVIGISELPVYAESEAIVGAPTAAPQCLLLLEPNVIGLYANSNSKLDADCGVQVNSRHKIEALFANSNSQIKASAVRVHGSSWLNSGSSVSPGPIDGSPLQADPLANLAEPASGGCTHTDFTVDNGETRTMSPGVYCKTTAIKSGSTAIMQPGVYVFRDGEFVVNSLSTVAGEGVMMFFENKQARLNVNADSVFEVTAPKSGTYAGMLIFQGRAPENSGGSSFIINSDADTKLEGTVYLPHGTLEINSLSTANHSAAYTAIIVRKLILNSFGTMTVRSNYNGTTPLPPLLAGFKNVTVARLSK